MRGRLTKLRTVDVVCAMTATVIGIIWKSTGNAVLANLLLQSIMPLAFYPAISGVIAGIAKEEAFPWVLATLCYVFMVLAIVVDWNSSSWYALVHPVISGFCGNGALATAVWWQNRKARRAV
jgi:phage shock protein PspC (stress-responsive transcriptional regulator)